MEGGGGGGGGATPFPGSSVVIDKHRDYHSSIVPRNC